MHLWPKGPETFKRPVGEWAGKKFKKMRNGRVVDRVTGDDVRGLSCAVAIQSLTADTSLGSLLPVPCPDTKQRPRR